MRLGSVVWVLSMTACGASWGLGGEEGGVLYTQCAEPKTYYLDADGDGWGDPNDEGLPNACDPPAGSTATNNRDCADSDVTNTGRVGSVCPQELVPSTSDVPAGTLVSPGSEYAFVYGLDTPRVNAVEAETNCTLWGAARLDDVLGEQLWSSTGHLATYGLQDDSLARTQLEIEAVVTGSFAAYIGVMWSGSVEEGSWVWVSYEEDDADDSLIDAIGWCADEAPIPEDFFPGLNPTDPTHRNLIEEEMDALRLALVWNASEGWCLGMPEDAGEDYGFEEGHVLCERIPPSPADYEPDFVEVDEADGN